MSSEMHTIFDQPRLDESEVSELIGLSRSIIEDGVITKEESDLLQNWLAAHAGITSNPVVCNLLRRVKAMLADEIADADESKDLFETLERFTGSTLDLTQILASSGLPLDDPAPAITFPDSRFSFAGTFAYGPRRHCEAAVERLGGLCSSLTPETDYLVVGVYTTENWVHASYGRKIERAVAMRKDGAPISIVGEPHWVGHIPR